jgi:ssDNA-binding Zn-finger/Zn-ribbon topoisomerase 1
MVEMAEIFRRYGPQYRAKYGDKMLPGHWKVMYNIERCRTVELGGHVYTCEECEETIYHYHSCRDRHCPKCQNGKAQQWLEKQQDLLPAASYFMLTFTLPSELRRVARSHQELFYNLLFRTSADAVQKLAQDPRFVGGWMGMVGVLHTWGRNLAYHPHVHYVVPGGGLAADGTWRPSRKNFLLPVKALSKVFRAKFRDALRQCAPDTFAEIPAEVWKKEWVVHSQPVGNGLSTFKYLAPYIFRVAISNRRILKLTNGKVTFRYRTTDTGTLRTCTLQAGEFIRRFLQHVLPKGFVKVRYYGFLASGCRPQLAALRQQLGSLATDQPSDSDVDSGDEPSAEQDSSNGAVVLCPSCGRPMQRRSIRPGEQCPQGRCPT